MGKIKFKPDLHKEGDETDNIIRIIAAHNSGNNPVSLIDIQSYMSCRKAILPISGKGYFATRPADNENILHISEDGGETWTLTIEEIEVEELPRRLTPEELEEAIRNW